MRRRPPRCGATVQPVVAAARSGRKNSTISCASGSGCSIAAKWPPRSVAARVYTDIRRWTTMVRGGHFAAMEQPEPLAQEIVEFFRPLRAAATTG